MIILFPAQLVLLQEFSLYVIIPPVDPNTSFIEFPFRLFAQQVLLLHTINGDTAIPPDLLNHTNTDFPLLWSRSLQPKNVGIYQQ